jgi:hypothetical protein
MPGTGFKAKAKVWHEYVKDSAEVPLKYVKDEMVWISRMLAPGHAHA